MTTLPSTITARRALLGAVAGAALGAAALPRLAHASDGDQSLTVYGGFATYTLSVDLDGDGQDDGLQPVGGLLALDYERGFSDSFAWRISGGGGVYTASTGAAYSGHATVGLTYLFDVLKYVPYANLGVGGLITSGAGQGADVSPLIELGAGLDVLRSRTFSWGVQVRFEALLQSSLLFTAGARVTWRWGLF